MKILGALVCVALLLASSEVGAAGAAAAGHPRLTMSTHGAFENCRARDITWKVTVPRLTFTAAQPVTYRVTIQNHGPTDCGPGESSSSPVQPVLTLGPCGAVAVRVDNARGHNVYPGVVAFHCPAEFGVPLPAGSSVSATGIWDQTAPGTSLKVPRGRYRLVIGGHVSFHLTLVAAS